MTKWFVIPCFKEWENQGNLLYQISPQISVCQRLHLRYQFIRDAFGPTITDHWELLDLTIACVPGAFSTIASLLHVGSDSICICSLLEVFHQLLPSTELEICQRFSKQIANTGPFNHHNNSVTLSIIMCPLLQTKKQRQGVTYFAPDYIISAKGQSQDLNLGSRSCLWRTNGYRSCSPLARDKQANKQKSNRIWQST